MNNIICRFLDQMHHAPPSYCYSVTYSNANDQRWYIINYFVPCLQKCLFWQSDPTVQAGHFCWLLIYPVCVTPQPEKCTWGHLQIKCIDIFDQKFSCCLSQCLIYTHNLKNKNYLSNFFWLLNALKCLRFSEEFQVCRSSMTEHTSAFQSLFFLFHVVSQQKQQNM